MKILIPAYEPRNRIIKLIDDIQAITDVEIIVVNDGSGKKCKEIFNKIEEKGIKVLTHPANKGKGEAIKTGVKYLLEIGEDEGFVSADCDGQHKPEDIVRTMQELTNSKKDLVLGYRDFNEKNVPFRSKFGNKISKFIFLAMTGQKVSDTQTGLRGYSRKIFEWLLEVPGSRYEYEFNILLGMKEKGIDYTEIKIETIYENNNEVSHFRPIKDSVLIYKPVCRFLISSIVSALIDISLLLIFEKIFKQLFLAVVISRIISSMVNFILNKNYVFEKTNNNNLLKMLVKYYSLVIVIMILNYGFLKVLYDVLSINLLVSKIITEVILYSFSFIIQKRAVFNKGKKN